MPLGIPTNPGTSSRSRCNNSSEAYLPTKWHLDPFSHLATTDIDRKLGLRPFGGELVPHLTQRGQGFAQCKQFMAWPARTDVFLYFRLTLFYKTLQKFPNCPTGMTAHSVALYQRTTPWTTNHGCHCQMLSTDYCQMWHISLPNGPESSYMLRHAFPANSKQLQQLWSATVKFRHSEGLP